MPSGAAHPKQDGLAKEVLRETVRVEWPRIVAPLVRLLGDVQRAEDCAQDAAVLALTTWSERGVPDEPRAWLITTARNRAIDLLRREARRVPVEQAAARQQAPVGHADTSAEDDLLRLVFLCCHPALGTEAQAALCLRLLCGLSTEEIARSFLTSEATMSRRLTRAKEKIRRASIPFTLPPATAISERLTGAAATVYLLFNEGYASTSGAAQVRPLLVREALGLGRLLHLLAPGSPTTAGLLALMVLHDSRRAARLDASGSPVLLAEQDRALWDRAAIVEGTTLLGAGLALSPEHPDAYVVQAAIAACHALAPSWESTNWQAIVSWYDVLSRVQPTPIVALNRAVAIGERDGAAAALPLVDGLTELNEYPLWHATRAELLLRLGRENESAAALVEALSRPLAEPLRQELQQRLDAIAGGER